ncbi:MAG: hypothetical protein EOO24_42245, partial [Comamonadaceae bacterium]
MNVAATPEPSRMAARVRHVLGSCVAGVLLAGAVSGCVPARPAQGAASIGSATMRPDGTIAMQLRAEQQGAVGDASFEIKPGDPRYK